jgi:AraC-like DNA-binding protein
MTAVPYRETLPPLALAAAIACAWERTPIGAGERPHSVAPDNSVDIILVTTPDGRELLSLDAVGPMTRPILVQGLAAERYLGIRFAPGWGASVLGLDVDALRDAHVPLRDVVPALDEALRNVLAVARRADAVTHAFAAIGAALARRSPPPAVVRRGMERLTDSGGRASIEMLSRDLRVSRQHLARAFQRHVGLSPKFVARVVRIRRASEAARRATRPAWGRIAAACGYADQSHLVADFRALLGNTPTGWSAAG